MKKTYKMGHDIGNEKKIRDCLIDMKAHLEAMGYTCEVAGNNFTTDCSAPSLQLALRLVRLDCEKFCITLVS